jgi:spore maturation protein CgeB
MKIVIFGLTISSSWGNGHATLWRGLLRALVAKGCRLVFYERDMPYYAATRDLNEIEGAQLVLYADWAGVSAAAARDLADCDVAIVTSYCSDALAASDLAIDTPTAISVFYDLDTPVTLSRLNGGEDVGYIGARGLRDFELVLSYTGGGALEQLRQRLGAKRVAPLYGHVDPAVHGPSVARSVYASDLSYLGTYSQDRQSTLRSLFIDAARRRSGQRFLIGGAQYPADFPWHPNIYFVWHLPPAEHAAFFSSSRLTLNVTRQPMRCMGWCPSGRLFEAAACGTPVISDAWEGLNTFYSEGSEILIARSTDDVIAALDLSDAEVGRIASAARERTLAQHTSAHRADELLTILGELPRSAAVVPALQGA